jgi:hypothetical protein
MFLKGIPSQSMAFMYFTISTAIFSYSILKGFGCSLGLRKGKQLRKVKYDQ